MSPNSHTAKLGGVIVPVITPLTAAGRVDGDSLGRLVEHCIDSGIDGVFVLGTSGEAMYFGEDDRVEVVRTAADAVRGRVPLYVGTIEMSAARLGRLIDTAAEVDAAGVVVPLPFYGRVGAAEVRQHYRMAFDRADGLDVIAYNIPNRTHATIDPGLLRLLIEDGTIAGLKDSDPDPDRHRDLVTTARDCQPGFPVLTGADRLALHSWRLGSAGTVPGLGNLAPGWFSALARAAAAQDWSAAEHHQQNINNLAGVLRAFPVDDCGPDSVTYACLKIALTLLDVINSPTTAAPLADLDTPGHRATVERVLHEVGLPSSASSHPHESHDRAPASSRP